MLFVSEANWIRQARCRLLGNNDRKKALDEIIRAIDLAFIGFATSKIDAEGLTFFLKNAIMEIKQWKDESNSAYRMFGASYLAIASIWLEMEIWKGGKALIPNNFCAFIDPRLFK